MCYLKWVNGLLEAAERGLDSCKTADVGGAAKGVCSVKRGGIAWLICLPCYLELMSGLLGAEKRGNSLKR